MLAGYKRNSRANRTRFFYWLGTHYPTYNEWKRRVNFGYIICKGKKGTMTPRDIRKRQIFNLQKLPAYREWYKYKLRNSNVFCSMKGGYLIYDRRG